MTESDEEDAKPKVKVPVYSTVQLPHTRFCGRCQRWVPDEIDIHYCVKAPRKIGYAWYEPDEPAVEKNAILLEGKPAKRGQLIMEFPANA